MKKTLYSITFLALAFGSAAQVKDQPAMNTMTAVPFTTLTTAPNVHGFLASEARPLMYNDQLNAVSFFMRKGPGYTSYPHNNTGSIIGYIGTSGGTVWDSTCVWTSTLQFGRYPQGGLVNPFGNTVIAQAHIVSMGPVQSVSGSWFGNFYASKTLSVAGTPTPGTDQQFISNTAPTYPSNQARHHFSRNNLSIPDDNRVRTMAGIIDDPSQPIHLQNPRGVVLVKGLFNAGAYTWTTDTFTPAFIFKTNGHRYVNSSAYQAWNESGSVGYLIMLGIPAGAYANNRAQQPIVYKTTNSGNTWAQIPSIDFNSGSFNGILKSLSPVIGNPCLNKPVFRHEEGIACVVDANGTLHMYTTLASGSSDLNDSLFNVKTFQQGGETYHWPFKPGFYPYLYDFYTDGTGDWNVNLVDSIQTESPGWKTSQPGYSLNPWDPDPANSNQKIPCGMRIQATRDASGANIMICWAESDTNFTQGATKFNTLPNLAARAYNCNTLKYSERQYLTKGGSPNIANRAFNHFLSPTSACTFTFGWSTFTVPIVVANSNPLQQNGDNRVYYSNCGMTFTLFNFPPLLQGTVCIVGTDENKNELASLEAYPNPSNSNLFLRSKDGFDGPLKIDASNVIGQKTAELEIEMAEDRNSLEVNTSVLPPGVYFIGVESKGEKRVIHFVKD